MQSQELQPPRDSNSPACELIRTVSDESNSLCRGKSRVLRVVDEIDALMWAMRILVRTCERETYHLQTHALRLSLELVLRRRNYLLNISSPTSEGGVIYDNFPCENCHITYPSVFIMSWLEFLLGPVCESGTYTEPTVPPGLCDTSCREIFSTIDRNFSNSEGSLYPLGAPFVSGPYTSPPSTTLQSVGPLDDVDELSYVHRSLRLVSETFHASDRKSDRSAVDTELADILSGLIGSRLNFGFDMDCVENSEVDLWRSRMYRLLKSYDYRVAGESFCQEMSNVTESVQTRSKNNE